jgi:hypothetical protein
VVRLCGGAGADLQPHLLLQGPQHRNGTPAPTQFDIKNKRIFLKRCEYTALQLKDIFVGAVLNVYSRQLKVIDFADEFTRSKFEIQRTK